ncbi:MAG: hypothetical protein LBM77_10545 [Spirochaetaceae bacterium]|nr:hypothetical protein [Spirochaetaceae bacterium]
MRKIVFFLQFGIVCALVLVSCQTGLDIGMMRAGEEGEYPVFVANALREASYTALVGVGTAQAESMYAAGQPKINAVFRARQEIFRQLNEIVLNLEMEDASEAFSHSSLADLEMININIDENRMVWCIVQLPRNACMQEISAATQKKLNTRDFDAALEKVIHEPVQIGSN